MNIAERDFSNFYLGDDVRELAGGLVREVAAIYGLALEGEGDADQMQSILSTIRSEKELRENPAIDIIAPDVKYEMVERSGIQKPLDRSLYNPDITASDAATRYVIPSAVANWVDRAANVLLEAPAKPVVITSGNRVMKQPTELQNQNIIDLSERLGRVPTETEYAARVIMPKLLEAGYDDVKISVHDSGNLDEISRQLFARNPWLRQERLAVVCNANAGLIKALQFRAAGRFVSTEWAADSQLRGQAMAFDANPSYPQVFAMTDGFPLSQSPEQDADSANYQKVDTAFGQMMLLPKKLVEVNFV